MEKHENQMNEEVTVEKVEDSEEVAVEKVDETTERMEESINEVVTEKSDRVEALKKEASIFVDKAGKQIENLDMNGLIEKIKKLFETKPLQSIGISLAIFLVLFFGIRKLTSDPLDGTYEILTRRDHLVMVIKGNAGTVTSEDSDGDKEKRLVKINKQKKELTITDDKGRDLGKTKYMLKDKELYLQEPDQTFNRVK